MATYITRPYPPGGLANKKPAGVHVQGIEYSPPSGKRSGSFITEIRVDAGYRYPVSEHLGALLLVDRQKGEAVDLDYHNNLEQSGDGQGNLSKIKLNLPEGKRLPAKLSVFVILDVFPIHEARLES
jgi:hypothetical protein